MEAWFLGDFPAIENGLRVPGLQKKYARNEKFRSPDNLAKPSAELKLLLGRYQKVAGAKAIAPHLNLDPEYNNSESYGVFISGVKSLLANG